MTSSATRVFAADASQGIAPQTARARAKGVVCCLAALLRLSIRSAFSRHVRSRAWRGPRGGGACGPVAVRAPRSRHMPVHVRGRWKQRSIRCRGSWPRERESAVRRKMRVTRRSTQFSASLGEKRSASQRTRSNSQVEKVMVFADPLLKAFRLPATMALVFFGLKGGPEAPRGRACRHHRASSCSPRFMPHPTMHRIMSL